MKMRVQLVIEDASGASTCTDIAAIERHTGDLIGLSLEEAKAMTGAVQRAGRGPGSGGDRSRLDLSHLPAAASTKRNAPDRLSNAIRPTRPR
jgi:hypothetical protein